LLELCDARGRLRSGELVWLAGQLGRALDAAHRQGIVHRDLKPSNVFVAEDDERQPTIKLCDFGIAKLIDAGGEASLETKTGALLGTPMYLAPEMLRGASEAVPATDQWALGLLAFRALAGTEYFGHARGFPGLVLAIANDPMVAPSARAPSLPAAFDAWFLRSCARDPAARFPDVGAQVAALAAALGNPAPIPIAPSGRSGSTGAGRPVEPAIEPTRPPAQAAPRSRARLLLLATTVAWAIGALAAVAWLGGRSRARQVAAATPAPSPSAAAPPPAVATATVRVPAPLAPAAPSPAAAPAPAAEPAPREEPPPAPRQAPATATSPAVAVSVKDKHAHHHHPEAHALAAPALPAEAPARDGPAHRAGVEPARGKAKGASCQRSAECASGLCAAETCL
jgi:serine/threonine-protein kinase